MKEVFRLLLVLVGMLPIGLFSQVKGTFNVVEANVTSFRSVNTMSRVARSGEGDVIIGWRSARQGVPYYNIYLQKVDRSGNLIWERDGLPLCPFPANQTYFSMVEDGFGGVVVVWEDYRRGSDYPMLYAQRINDLGEPLWGKDGLAICNGQGGQRKPQIASDLSKGFFVVWEDYRRGFEDSDIFGQYIDLAGKPKWDAGGLAIAARPGIQKNVSIATDEDHILYLIWEDFRNQVYWNIYSQKIKPDGSAIWTEGGLDIFAGVEENHQNPAMVPDGYGGLLFVYQKYSVETHGTDIYRGRLSPGGEVSYHFATCFSKDEQQHPKIVKKGSKALLCWEDRRSGNWDIYAQMIRLRDGILEWGINGLPVANSSKDEKEAEVITAASYGYQVFSWHESEGNVYRIGVQKLDNLGQPAWGTDGRQVCTYSNDQTEPCILTDENGGLWCSWTDRREQGTAYVFLQHFGGTGRPLLNPTGLKLAGEHSKPFAMVTGLRLLAGRAGDFYVVWEDYRNGEKNSDIYIQKYDASGKALWRSNGIPICLAPGDQNRPFMIEDGVGGVIVAWFDRRNGKDDNIFAQRISSWGKTLWADEGIVVCDAPGDQSSLRGVTDGKEGAVFCWVDARSVAETGFDLYIQRIGYEGSALWQENGKPFAKYPGLQTSPSLQEDGNGGAYVAWMDSRGANSNIYVQHMNEFGLAEWEAGGRCLVQSNVNQRHPEILRNFENDLYIVWQEGRFGDGYEKLFMQCITPDGHRLWDYGGTQVCKYPGRQSKPMLVGDAGGNFWVAWLDQRDQNRLGVQLLAQKFNIGGDPQWQSDGIWVGESMEEWNDYEIGINKRGYMYLVWNQKTASGKKNVFYQKLHPDGVKKFDYSGIRLGDEDEDQLSPVIAVNLEGRALVCWIQYDPSQKTYGIRATFVKE